MQKVLDFTCLTLACVVNGIFSLTRNVDEFVIANLTRNCRKRDMNRFLLLLLQITDAEVPVTLCYYVDP